MGKSAASAPAVIVARATVESRRLFIEIPGKGEVRNL
jgi:hypothetical protein